MTEPFGGLRRFFRELKRRNVYKVAAAYLVVAFVGLQAVDLIIPASTLPAWADSFLLAVAVLGFPIALVVAWAFEMTPEGMRRTESPAPSEETKEERESETRWAVQILAALGLIAVAGAGLWQFTPLGDEDGGGETTTPRIAVLPFENIAGDSANASFTSGMHTEVLNQLSKVTGLEVLSRTTMIELADAGLTAAEIGREHDVQAILEGTVNRAAGEVRITTQLIDTPEDEQLWSNTYQRQLSVDAIFEIQADIAQEITRAMETQLTEGERRRIESAPTDDLAAYDAYLKGRNAVSRFWATRDLAQTVRAISHLREAIDLDPSFAEAHAWLAIAYVLSRAEGKLDSAAAAAEQAKAIDPDVAAVHLAQSYVYRDRNAQAARIEALRRAVELQPSHGFATAELSNALEDEGHYAEAVRVAHRAVRLAPRHPLVLQEMGDQLRAVGLYDASAAWDRRVLEIEPGHFESVRGFTNTLLLRDQPDRALRTWKSYLEKQEPNLLALSFAAYAALKAGLPEQAKGYAERLPEVRAQARTEEALAGPEEGRLSPWDQRIIGLAELRLGKRERGRKLLSAAVESFRNRLERKDGTGDQFELTEVFAQLGLAGAYAALDETERALRVLEQEILPEPGNFDLLKQYLLITPFFENLRSEPRFQKIVEQIQAERRKAREEVLQMDLDLYPPGAEADSVR